MEKKGPLVVVANWSLSEWSTRIRGSMMEAQYWRVSDALWERVERLLPEPKPRRFRYPGRRPADDRACFEGIVYVLTSGLPWRTVPRHEGRPCASACYARFQAWTRAGVWDRLHQVVIDELAQQGRVDLSRALVDSTLVVAKKGASCSAKARTTGAGRAASAISSSMP